MGVMKREVWVVEFNNGMMPDHTPPIAGNRLTQLEEAMSEHWGRNIRFRVLDVEEVTCSFRLENSLRLHEPL